MVEWNEGLSVRGRFKVDFSMTHLECVPLRWVAGVEVLLAGFVYLTGFTASPDDAGIAYQAITATALVSVLTFPAGATPVATKFPAKPPSSACSPI